MMLDLKKTIICGCLASLILLGCGSSDPYKNLKIYNKPSEIQYSGPIIPNQISTPVRWDGATQETCEKSGGLFQNYTDGSGEKNIRCRYPGIGWYSYKIKPGDTLWDILNRNSIPTEQIPIGVDLILNANPRLTPEGLHPGDIIVVPNPHLVKAVYEGKSPD